jgi:hypothetical protein
VTEPEVLALLEEQFLDEAGFVAKLCRGDGLDREAVENVRAALDELADLWADRTHVPKRSPLPLVDLSTPILECRERYPELATELYDLAMDLVHRIERVVYTRLPRMTEDEAVAIVYGHLTGMYGVALQLHHPHNRYPRTSMTM